jgi:hypothetical protein
MIFLVSDEVYHLVTGDLNRARQLLEKLRATVRAPENKIVREALTLAAVVSYCRPFHKSRDADKRWHMWLSKEFVDALPEKCQRFHKKLLDERNEAWAHTDWKQHEPRLLRMDGGTSAVVSRNPWIPMDEAEIAGFVSLLDEVDAHVQLLSRTSGRIGRE